MMIEHQSFDWLHSVAIPYFNFFLFVGLLLYLARKPIAGILQKRAKDFEELQRSALAAKKSADQKLAELNSRLAGLDAEMSKVKEESKKSVEQEAEKIISDAKKFALHLQEDAQRSIDREMQKAMRELRMELWEQVQQKAVAKFREDLQGEAMQKHTNDQIKELELLS